MGKGNWMASIRWSVSAGKTNLLKIPGLAKLQLQMLNGPSALAMHCSGQLDGSRLEKIT